MSFILFVLERNPLEVQDHILASRMKDVVQQGKTLEHMSPVLAFVVHSFIKRFLRNADQSVHSLVIDVRKRTPHHDFDKVLLIVCSLCDDVHL